MQQSLLFLLFRFSYFSSSSSSPNLANDVFGLFESGNVVGPFSWFLVGSFLSDVTKHYDRPSDRLYSDLGLDTRLAAV